MAHLLMNLFIPTSILTPAGALIPAHIWFRHRTFEACSAISLHASTLSLVELAARSNSEYNVLALLVQYPLRFCKLQTPSIFSRGDALQ